jgi:hypothetical protein
MVEGADELHHLRDPAPHLRPAHFRGEGGNPWAWPGGRLHFYSLPGWCYYVHDYPRRFARKVRDFRNHWYPVHSPAPLRLLPWQVFSPPTPLSPSPGERPQKARRRDSVKTSEVFLSPEPLPHVCGQLGRPASTA